MRNKIRSLTAVLALGALASTSQAQTTIMSEDFESYTNGTPLGIPGWVAQASNVTAVVTNDGSSLVGDFSGYANEVGGNNWDHNANLIGLVLTNLAVSGNISPFLSDYTLEFDLAKLAGVTSFSTEVWIRAGGSSIKYVVADPSVGAGPQHYSVNLKDYTELQGTFPIDSMTTMQVDVQYYGPSGPNVPDSVYTEYQVDNIEITVTPGPFYPGTYSPTGAKVGVDQTISGSVIDLAMEVDSMVMTLDGSSVASSSSYAGGSTTNTLTYNATGLSEGPHVVKIEATDALSTANLSYKWDFYVAADGPTIPVAFEGFESYSTGTWNVATAPEANPEFYLNGGTAQYATIVDEDGTNQALQLDVNLSNMWQVGLSYDLDANGYNASKDINDYSMEFYLTIPEGYAIVASRGLYLNIRDANDNTRGTQYNVGTIDSAGLLAAGSGRTKITIPLSAGSLASGASKPATGSAETWRVQFLFSGSSQQADEIFVLVIDDMIVNYIKPPFMNETWSPVGVTTNDPTVSASVTDGTNEVDTMVLYLDGNVVASNSYAGGSTINTISYDWIGAPVGTHTGTVVAVAASLYAETNSWTFAVPAPPPPASSNPSELYNINFTSNPDMGNGTQHYQPVPDGYVAAAPSMGSNNWLNAIHTPWWWWNGMTYQVNAASGTNSNFITYSFLVDDSPVINMQVPWSWGSQEWVNTTTNTMWATCFGSLVDLNLQLSGVDTSETYDLYLYYVNPESTNPATTTYTITTGSAPVPEATLTSTKSTVIVEGSYTNLANFVENENYVVITGISPSSSGIIGLNVSGNPGGLSAMQLAVRGPWPGASVVPNIQSVSMAGGMVTLEWESENGATYNILSKTSLTQPGWSPVSTNIPGYGATSSTDVPAASGQEFFMIEAY